MINAVMANSFFEALSKASMGEKLFLVLICVALLILWLITTVGKWANINSLKSKTVGDGQHGTARWATKKEIRETWKIVPFTPLEWRKKAKAGKPITWHNPQTNQEEPLPQGIVIGQEKHHGKQYCWVDDNDVHTLMIGAAGVGKTAFWLYPCIEYALASGISFLSTDTKGDIMRNYGKIAEEQYGYHISIIDLRNPTKSHGNNLLNLVNKYMDLAKEHPEEIKYRAKSEKYAKIIAKTIILAGMDGSSFGQNAYFYDAAEGLLTSTILLVSEFCEDPKRHIVSVFKIIQELLAPAGAMTRENEYQALMKLLPDTHKAKWLAGAALHSSDQSMASVMSTALSRLLTFIDSEMEQLLCFDTEIDAEEFCENKSAVFLIMPEENPNTFFMVSLIIQQLYREILSVADEQGGALKRRAIFFCDEFGTLPKIESAEMMFSASRSRRLQIVPIIQSFAQLDKNYGKEGAEIIIDNTQLTLFGGFAPNSQTAEKLSAALGSRTILSGSISKSKDGGSVSENMIERRLMTPDELKSMPKGHFICMKTGRHPAQVELKLYMQWGIPEFSRDEKDWYEMPDFGNRVVEYADRQQLRSAIEKKFPKETVGGEFSEGGFRPAGDDRDQLSNIHKVMKRRFAKAELYKNINVKAHETDDDDDDDNDGNDKPRIFGSRSNSQVGGNVRDKIIAEKIAEKIKRGEIYKNGEEVTATEDEIYELIEQETEKEEREAVEREMEEQNGKSEDTNESLNEDVNEEINEETDIVSDVEENVEVSNTEKQEDAVEFSEEVVEHAEQETEEITDSEDFEFRIIKPEEQDETDAVSMPEEKPVSVEFDDEIEEIPFEDEEDDE